MLGAAATGEAELPTQLHRLPDFGPDAFDGARATVIAMLRAAFTLADPQQRNQLSDTLKHVHAVITMRRPDLDEVVRAEVKTADPTAVSLPNLAATLATTLIEQGLQNESETSRPEDGKAQRLAKAWLDLGTVVQRHDAR